jgi:hypothetical protein
MSFPSFGENFKGGSVVNKELNDKLINLVEQFSKEI